jgi:two-component system CheB/CheR fusion protein
MNRDRTVGSGKQKRSRADKAKATRRTGGRGKRLAGKKSFPVVGIGASAGGVSAVKELLQALPGNANMALILIQHLDPKHKSMLPEILAKVTALPVAQVEKDTDLEPGKVFVIPPNKLMQVQDGKLILKARPKKEGSSTLVDALLESLAEAYKHLAIGVILSGSGSDGTFGVRAIKSLGGITFAQSRESAEYYSMPEGAIASGSVDFVLPPAEIAKKLMEINDHPYLKGVSVVPEKIDVQVGDSLTPIFNVLNRSKGVDFSLYRRSTIERRVERRMALKRLENYEEYVKLLKRKPEEIEALYEDLLIQVTSFFRTPELYRVLEEKIYPRLVDSRDQDDPLRVWVPGCSTGEEAYSLAISLARFLESRELQIPLRVFGTDLNENLIERARQGVYPESISEQVPVNLLSKFFLKSNGGYQVQRFMRDLCVFAKHDLTKDPPFSNVDLLSCRNVMIYLQPILQDRLLPVFHYALKPKGFLVLGSSESVGTATDLFQAVDKKHRIFAKRMVSRQPELSLDQPPFVAHRRGRHSARQKEVLGEVADMEREFDDLLLSKYVPAAVLVDDHMRIVSFRGNAGPFLRPASGRASLDVMSMVQPGLAVDLASALDSAKESNDTVKRPDLQVEIDDRLVGVDLEVKPVGAQGDYGYFLIVFRETRPRISVEEVQTAESEGAKRDLIARLRREIALTKRHLQSIIEQKEASNEELKSANEEITSSNEELQSLNEEMETSREELQSTNEELITLNEELQHRNEELARVNSDLNNILENTQIPIIIVDRDLNIRLFTPSANRLLNLRDSDGGRPLTDITLRADVPDLADLVNRVVSEVIPIEREIRDREGCWFDLRVRPYVGIDKRIEGAVISFIDISDFRKSVEKSSHAELLSKRILEMAPVPMAVLDRQLKITSVNQAFVDAFGITKERAEGSKFFGLNGGMFDVPEIAQSLEGTSANEVSMQSAAFELKSTDGGKQNIIMEGRRLESNDASGPHFVLTFKGGSLPCDAGDKPGVE